MDEKTRELDDVIRHVGQMESRLDDYERRRFEYFLGNGLDEALNSREAAHRLFNSPNSKLRRGAFSLELGHWIPESKFEASYRKAAFDDPDPGVRAEALGCLVYLYRGSKDKEFSAMLARMIREDANAAQLRRAAHYGLYEVQGRALAVDAATGIIRAGSDRRICGLDICGLVLASEMFLTRSR